MVIKEIFEIIHIIFGKLNLKKNLRIKKLLQ